MVEKFILKLYIMGQTPRSERAIINLRHICENGLRDQYEIIIVDVLEHPQLAEQEKVIATPTLIKVSPPPTRRIIGDLSDTEKVIQSLGLEIGSTFKRG